MSPHETHKIWPYWYCKGKTPYSLHLNASENKHGHKAHRTLGVLLLGQKKGGLYLSMICAIHPSAIFANDHLSQRHRVAVRIAGSSLHLRVVKTRKIEKRRKGGRHPESHGPGEKPLVQALRCPGIYHCSHTGPSWIRTTSPKAQAERRLT